MKDQKRKLLKKKKRKGIKTSKEKIQKFSFQVEQKKLREQI